MPTFAVSTPQGNYSAMVERGSMERIPDHLPDRSGKVFVISTADVWRHQGHALQRALSGRTFETLFLPGGEEQKRLAPLEAVAEQMVALGADRSSIVVAFGGGIVNDMAGFLAAIFMRGIPVVQVPTTLLAQVDAAVGGKTGVNLVGGKNLIGSFHQPLAVLIDPQVLDTLPDREYRAGLYEVIKCGVIASRSLFCLLADRRADVLERRPDVVDTIISESVRIKAEVVSADERESGLRRILNFGHTFGHALEAETHYSRFLHGEAVAWGMRAAVYLAETLGYLSAGDAKKISRLIEEYGPIPTLDGVAAEPLHRRMGSDKKTVQGKIHFVLPVGIGEVKVVADAPEEDVLSAIRRALR